MAVAEQILSVPERSRDVSQNSYKGSPLDSARGPPLFLIALSRDKALPCLKLNTHESAKTRLCLVSTDTFVKARKPESDTPRCRRVNCEDMDPRFQLF